VAVDDLILRRTFEIPWIVSFYGADLYQLGRRPDWQEKYARVFDQATFILALGPMMAARLRQIGCPEKKIVIHPLGVDIQSLPHKPRLLRAGETLKILFAGTFREKKGVQYLIRAAALAQRVGVRLEVHLVGDAMTKPGDRETKNEIFREIGKLGLEDLVTHHPFLSFQELIRLALCSHVFVAPSITAVDGDAEGTPFVLQQLMATGMPAIATAHSDIPYLFGEHKHMLVPERDAKAIAERLQYYTEVPDRLGMDGMALRDRTQQMFNVRLCANRLSELYDAVLRT